MFKSVSSKDGAVNPFEYLPAAAGAYSVGEIVKAEGGKVAKLDSVLEDMPQYICMHEGEVLEGDIIAVARVRRDTIYETKFVMTCEGATIGSLLEVSGDGMGVDNLAEGAFEICAVDGTEKGDKVRGRFV